MGDRWPKKFEFLKIDDCTVKGNPTQLDYLA